MSVQLGFILLYFLLTFIFTSMHGLPCSSLGHCFGNPSDVNTDPCPSQEPDNSRRSRNNHGLQAADPVRTQPEPLPCILHERQMTVISTRSTKTKKVNGICPLQDRDKDQCSESPPPRHSFSQSSEDDELELDYSPELQLKYPQIPRPAIIFRQLQVGIGLSVWLLNILKL